MTVTDALAPLLVPGRIGTLTLRNRMLMCPIGDALADADGCVSDRQLAYFEARARGGAALLLVGSVAVAYPRGAFSACQTAASRPEHEPALRRLADVVHRHGAAIAAQLVHDGPQSLHDIEQASPVLLPSPPAPYRGDRLSAMVTPDEATRMASPFTREGARFVPHVATEADLAAVVAAFADAARRCRDAGFDAVELHAGHGYLLDAFRSPATNHRDDGYGGDTPRRERLLLETIAAVRDAVGPEFPVWCRLNALEHFRTPGETLAETLELAPRLEAAGLDALHVTAYADPGAALGVTEAHTPSRPGALVEHARAVKARVGIPVITFGRLDPHAAADAIASGAADFVAMGRKLLADPELPNKVAAGALDDVRPCIYQYRCIGNIFVRGSVACVANPETAHERELALDRAPAVGAPRHIAVVGAGPAGLETAWRLAHLGHDVELWEARDDIGGLLALAARADDDLAALLAWHRRQLARLDVAVRTGVVVDAAAVAAGAFDAVVLATGAPPSRRDIPGSDAPHVRTLDDLVMSDALAAGPVAVLGGGKAGCSLAMLFRRRGDPVTIVEPSGVFAVELGLPGRFRLVHDLETAGVTLLTGTPTAIDGDSVAVTTNGDTRRLEATSVVLASDSTARPAPPLAAALRDDGRVVHVVGEARAAGRIEGALADAAALAISFGRVG